MFRVSMPCTRCVAYADVLYSIYRSLYSCSHPPARQPTTRQPRASLVCSRRPHPWSRAMHTRSRRRAMTGAPDSARLRTPTAKCERGARSSCIARHSRKRPRVVTLYSIHAQSHNIHGEFNSICKHTLPRLLTALITRNCRCVGHA